ncbi:membrane protein insertion efficiency factor YidD [Vibrio nigripulchritudo]|uniref:membrane protein insertion efficiency factor YidD n=1 Tax=Vibrio nigripulchritudo TaxID=28173 RepID=UPI00068DBB3F
MKYMAILLIKFYQRFISPYKGFRCAHACLHQGDSCSEAVKKIIQEHGVFSSRTRISQRFSACRVANDTLKRERKKKKDKKENDQFCDNTSCCVDALSLKKDCSDCSCDCW